MKVLQNVETQFDGKIQRSPLGIEFVGLGARSNERDHINAHSLTFTRLMRYSGRRVSFVGNIDQFERGAGGGFPSYTAYTKGHFCWGAKDVACGVQRYPYHEGMVSAGTRDRVFDTRAGW